jgi:hydrogenase maturation factor HypF (carbamoyltransferase family)
MEQIKLYNLQLSGAATNGFRFTVYQYAKENQINGSINCDESQNCSIKMETTNLRFTHFLKWFIQKFKPDNLNNIYIQPLPRAFPKDFIILYSS